MTTTFDHAKRNLTLTHRGLDFAVDAEKVFSGDTVTVVDDRFDYGEVRRSAQVFSMTGWSSSYGPGGIQAATSSQ
jgi:uncharacterized DUF497 family protein